VPGVNVIRFFYFVTDSAAKKPEPLSLKSFIQVGLMLMGKLPFLANIILMFAIKERLVTDKQSSLFGLIFSDEQKKSSRNTDTR
jgi:hypothetical protein